MKLKITEATQIVDLFHACEHLHDLAGVLEFMLGDHKQDWLAARLENLDYGDIDGIGAAEALMAERAGLAVCLDVGRLGADAEGDGDLADRVSGRLCVQESLDHRAGALGVAVHLQGGERSTALRFRLPVKWRSRLLEPSEYPARIVVGAGDPYACWRSGSLLACPPCPIRVPCLGSRREAGGTLRTGGSCIQRERQEADAGQQACAVEHLNRFRTSADQLTCGFSPA